MVSKTKTPAGARLLSGAMLAASAAAPASGEVTLDEIAVVASADSGELRRNASTAKIVFGRDELDSLDAVSIGELLGKLPGTGMFGELESKRGKGKGPDRMMPRILVDGQPLPGGERNPATALRLPADLIERVEIIRNGSAEFPAAGPGGIINLVLRDVPSRATKSARIGLGGAEGEGVLRADSQFGDNAGDFGYLLAGSLGSRPLGGRRETGIQLFAGGSRSAWTLERTEQHGRDGNFSLTPRFNWSLGGGRSFTLSPFLSHTEDERREHTRRLGYADPVVGSVLAAVGDKDERADHRRSSGRLTAEWKSVQPGGSELSARLMLQGESETQSRHERESDAAGTLSGTRAEDVERRERETAFFLRGKQLVGESHVVTGGAEWHRAGSDEKKAVRKDGLVQSLGADSASSLRENRLALWLQDEWQLAEAHLLTPGLRWQAQRVRIADGLGAVVEQGHQSLDPSLHYLWQLDAAWNLRGSATLSGKPPRTRDLSPVLRAAGGTNSSANPDRGGNPALEAERNFSVEAGIEHFLPNRQGTVGFSLFRRRIDNQIQRLTQQEGGRWVERPFNVGDAVLGGGLLDFKLRGDAAGWPPLSALTLRGNYALSHTRLDSAKPGLGAGEGPRRSWNLGFDYELTALRLTLGGNYSHVSALDRESSATVRQTQGARRQLDLYALMKLERQLSLRFSTLNAARAGRENGLREADGAGKLARLEHERETSVPTFLVTLEGKW